MVEEPHLAMEKLSPHWPWLKTGPPIPLSTSKTPQIWFLTRPMGLNLFPTGPTSSFVPIEIAKNLGALAPIPQFQPPRSRCCSGCYSPAGSSETCSRAKVPLPPLVEGTIHPTTCTIQLTSININ